MDVRFTSVNIGGFRAIQHLKLDGLGTINLFVGVNNAGKTSVLEALALLSSPIDPNNWVRIAKRRSIYAPALKFNAMETLRWLFPKTIRESNTNEEIRIAAATNLDNVDIHASFSESENAIPPEWASKRVLSTQGSRGEELYRFAWLDIQVNSSNDVVREQFDVWEDFGYPRLLGSKPKKLRFPCEIITPFSHTIEEGTIRGISHKVISEEPDIRKNLVQMLKPFDSDILDLEVWAPDGSGRLYVRHRRVGLAPLHIFGDGFRRALGMALAIYRSRGGILLVDEIETAIHTTALSQFYRWLVEQCHQNQVQLFATTHSLEAVDTLVAAVQEHQQDDLVAFRLSPHNEFTDALRLAGSQLARLRFELGQEIR